MARGRGMCLVPTSATCMPRRVTGYGETVCLTNGLFLNGFFEFLVSALNVCYGARYVTLP